MKSLISILFLCLFLVSCGGKKSKEEEIAVSFKGFLGSDAFPGGVMVYGRDFERGLFFSRYISGGNDKIVLSNGNWAFAAVAYAGPNPLQGFVKCDLTNTFPLNGGDAIVNFSLSTQKCAKDEFGPNEFTYADGQFFDMRFVTCARPDQVEKAKNQNCQLGRAQSFKITFLEAAVGPSLNPILFGGVSSACIGNGPTAQAYFDPASFYKIPVGSELIPVPIVITAYDQDNCNEAGDKEDYVFGRGLFFGDERGSSVGNVSNDDLKASVFLKSNMCQGDGSTNTPFAQGAAVNSPNGNFICNEAQLQQVAPAVNGVSNRIFSLEDDVILTADWDSYIIGTSGTPFIGQFYGNGKTISDLTITAPIADGVGFIGHAGNGAKVEDLNIDYVDVNGAGYNGVGSFIGIADGVSLKNIHVYDDILETAGDVESVSGSNVGGLIGQLVGTNDYTIEAVSATNLEITGTTAVGGMIGFADTPAASASLLFDFIVDTPKVEGDVQVGGVIGFSELNAGTIAADWDVIDLTLDIQVSGGIKAGGLIGEQLASAGQGLFFGMRANGEITVPIGSTYLYMGGMFGRAVGVQGAGFYANVDFDNSLISGGGNTHFGGFAGSGETFFAIQNARVEGTGWGCNDCNYVGGFLGQAGVLNAGSGVISDSSAHGNVTGKGFVGGFIGESGDADLIAIRNYATGDASGPINTTDIGGFIGQVTFSTIQDSYSTGDVTTGSTSDRQGGFVGFGNAPIIQRAFSTGNADGTAGSNRGAFGGFITGGTVANIYFDDDNNTITDAAATGLTTAQMTTTGTLATNFSGFLFGAGNPWVDSGANGLPQLRFENFYNELGSFSTGSFFDPIQICTRGQWNTIGDQDFLKYTNILLVCDIDFSLGFNPIGSASIPFEGNLLGNNRTLSNIAVSSPGQDNLGLIAVADGANIAHDDGYGGYHALYLNNVQIRGQDNVGLVVGAIDGQSVEDTNIVSVIIDGNSVAEGRDNVGGVVGYVSSTATGILAGVISAASVDANNSPTAAGGTGGLVGYNNSNSFMTANSIVVPNGNASQINGLDNVGGLVGVDKGVSGSSGGIQQSANFGAPVIASGNKTGGVVGQSQGTVFEVLSVSEVNGTANVGGLVGEGVGSFVLSNSFCSYCDVTGAAGSTAGLVGNVSTGNITYSYSYGTSLNGGSTEGIANGSPGADATVFTDAATCNGTFTACTKTNTQMLDITTYGSYDFGLWLMEDGFDTPKLRWTD